MACDIGESIQSVPFALLFADISFASTLPLVAFKSDTQRLHNLVSKYIRKRLVASRSGPIHFGHSNFAHTKLPTSTVKYSQHKKRSHNSRATPLYSCVEVPSDTVGGRPPSGQSGHPSDTEESASHQSHFGNRLLFQLQLAK